MVKLARGQRPTPFLTDTELGYDGDLLTPGATAHCRLACLSPVTRTPRSVHAISVGLRLEGCCFKIGASRQARLPVNALVRRDANERRPAPQDNGARRDDTLGYTGFAARTYHELDVRSCLVVAIWAAIERAVMMTSLSRVDVCVRSAAQRQQRLAAKTAIGCVHA